LIDISFDNFLIFQIKCTGCRSDKTLGLGYRGFTSGTAHAGLDRRPLDTIPLTDNDNLFTLYFHHCSPLYLRKMVALGFLPQHF
jgi:hypothetical protein